MEQGLPRTQVQKIERLIDCKDTTPEEKNEIFKKMYEDRQKKWDERKKARFATKSFTINKTGGTKTPKFVNDDDGRLDMLIEDSIRDAILADYGSDFNAMSEKTFGKVIAERSDVVVTK